MYVPRLSVVIASYDSASVIDDCLAALQRQSRDEDAEIIVSDCSGDGTADLIQERFPSVRLLRFDEPSTIPVLRGTGIAAARGEIVAILDPYCVVSDGWSEEVLALHDKYPELVIGGAVELDRSYHPRLVNWATYFCEYGAFMLPLDAGPARELTGNNIAYKRGALAGVSATGDGFWKSFLNHELQSQGHHFRQAPSLVVHLHKPIPFVEFFCSRYHHGRCFGAMRVAHAPLRERLFRALTAPLIPAITLQRRVRGVWPKRRNRERFILALPLLLMFDCSWAWGEMWGYLGGHHESCGKLRF